MTFNQQIGAMGTGRRVQGHSFPMRPLGETTSQNSGSKRDMVSQTGLLRKMHPGIPTRNGTHFPSRGPMGNCVPFRAGIPGCIFRKRPVWETISRFEPEFWDAVSPRGLIGKRYPGIRPDGGMRFPNDPLVTEGNESFWAAVPRIGPYRPLLSYQTVNWAFSVFQWTSRT